MVNHKGPRGGLKQAHTHRAAPGSVAAKEAEQPEPTRKPVKSLVLKYLNSHIGLPIHLDDIVEATKGRRESIQATMGTLIKEGVLNIKVVQGGNSWVFRGLNEDAVKDAAPVVVGSVRMYEEMGTDKAGRRILKDEEGNLWAAEEL